MLIKVIVVICHVSAAEPLSRVVVLALADPPRRR